MLLSTFYGKKDTLDVMLFEALGGIIFKRWKFVFGGFNIRCPPFPVSIPYSFSTGYILKDWIM